MELDFKKVDLYELFEVPPEATEDVIKRSYRKKALIYHPDKNRDNPKANEVFQQLSKALEVLTDKEARTAYDKILIAKKEREVRTRKLDAKRRKLQEELETREKLNQEISIEDEEEKLNKEIERIRKEGSIQLEEENHLLQEKLKQQQDVIKSKLVESELNRIKIKRKNKSVITEELLRNKFSTFGQILFMIVSKNQKSAIVEFEEPESLSQIMANCPENFQCEIVSQRQSRTSDTKHQTRVSKEDTSPRPVIDSHDNYEDFVLRRLQEAQKNKRQMNA